MLTVEKELSEKNDKLNNLLKEAQAVKQNYEDKLSDLSKQGKLLELKIGEHNSAIKSCQVKEEKTESLNEDLAEVIKQTESKGKSFDKMNAELDNEKKRLEILDLKLQKLARDKGLEKELEELKKSLA